MSRSKRKKKRPYCGCYCFICDPHARKNSYLKKVNLKELKEFQKQIHECEIKENTGV